MIRTVALLAALLCSFLASGSAQAQTESLTSQQPSQPLKLLMVLWRGETDAERGFLDQLQQQVPLEVTRINAQQDRSQLARELWSLAPNFDQFDLLYSFGTTASVMTKSVNRERAPQLYSMVHNPAAAGLEPATPTSPPLTGSTDAIPARQQLNVARQLFDIKRIGLLFNSREQNSRIQLEELELLCQEMGIKLVILRVAPNSQSLENHLARLRASSVDIDTLYLPNDSYIISQSKQIMAAVQHPPYRAIGTHETFVRDGALLAVAPDFEAMGRNLARLLLELQADGFRSHLPPITVEQQRIIYNDTTRQRLKVQIPDTLAGKLVAIP